MTKKDLVIILPAYNEGKYLTSVLKALSKMKYPFVVVDDASSDKTSTIALKYTQHVLRHDTNKGKGAALRTGCEYAFKNLHAEAVLFMDSDAQHDPDEVDGFFAAIKKCNVVLGVRAFDTTMPLIRIIGNRLASFFVLLVFGTYVPDIPSGYKAIHKSVYHKLLWKSNGYKVELEIAVNLIKHKIAFVAIPIKTIYLDMTRGFQPSEAFKMLFDLISWRLFGIR